MKRIMMLIISAVLLAACSGKPEPGAVTPVPTDIPAAAEKPAESPAVPTISVTLAAPADPLGFSDFNISIGIPEELQEEDPADPNLCLADETASDGPDCYYGEGSAEFDSDGIMDYTMPDLDGETVRLGSLLFGHRITMLNVWGISCGPCLVELPHLAELRDRFSEQGFEIVGLTADLLDPDGSLDPELISEAKDVVSELGVDYPILAMTKEIRDLMKITATPTTYFVNSSGQVIGEAIMGSKNADEWESVILSILAKG